MAMSNKKNTQKHQYKNHTGLSMGLRIKLLLTKWDTTLTWHTALLPLSHRRSQTAIIRRLPAQMLCVAAIINAWSRKSNAAGSQVASQVAGSSFHFIQMSTNVLVLRASAYFPPSGTFLGETGYAQILTLTRWAHHCIKFQRLLWKSSVLQWRY